MNSVDLHRPGQRWREIPPFAAYFLEVLGVFNDIQGDLRNLFYDAFPLYWTPADPQVVE